MTGVEQPTGPLAGVRVVDLTINVLGPVCTQILADMGADVIKVEGPNGDDVRRIGPCRSDGMSVFFLNMNRNKRSIKLDLKQPNARAALSRLIETADVFVHCMRPGAVQRLGLDYEHVRSLSAGIVYAWASGFRKNSSRKESPAFDDVIQGESGLAAMNQIDGVPRFFPTVICDKLSGYILASSIAMALFARERTGAGQEVHVPMMESMLAFSLVEHLWGGVLDGSGIGLGYPRMLTPHRRPHRTKDGYITLLASNNDQWHRLFGALDREDLAGDPRFSTIEARTENIALLYEIVGSIVKTRSTREWLERLARADIPSGVVNGLDDLMTNEYLVETGFFQRMQHPTEGTIVSMAVPVEFSKTKASTTHRPAPLLGQHTEEILRELEELTKRCPRQGNSGGAAIPS